MEGTRVNQHPTLLDDILHIGQGDEQHIQKGIQRRQTQEDQKKPDDIVGNSRFGQMFGGAGHHIAPSSSIFLDTKLAISTKDKAITERNKPTAVA
ncbi:hypothetical protein D3C81_2020860 [compost metagenome]